MVLFVIEKKRGATSLNHILCKVRKTETFHMLQTAFEDVCMSRSIGYDWFKRCKGGQCLIADHPRSGHLKILTDNDHHRFL